MVAYVMLVLLGCLLIHLNPINLAVLVLLLDMMVLCCTALLH